MRCGGIERGFDGLPKILDGAGGGGASQRFEFCESHFDWVEIGRIWRQIEKSGPGRRDGLAHAGDFVRRQIVHDDDVAGGEDGISPGQACVLYDSDARPYSG